MRYNTLMSKNTVSKTLAKTNQHLRNGKTSKKMRIRSIASSTAIETRESIRKIEKKIIRERTGRYQVKLA